MNQISRIINNYLIHSKTDYSIFINGKWGSGKTHFVKNILFEEIKQMKCDSESEKNRKYEPVYISLFGISDENEFYERLFIELNPKLKSKGAFWINKFLKKISSIFSFEWLNSKDAKDYIGVYSVPIHKVLFFDDLERAEHSFLPKLLGLINMMVEHQNIKTIIIGDEEVIQSKKNEVNFYGYGKYKEKLIRFTYNFKGDIHSVYDTIANSYNESYREFLFTNKSWICSSFYKGNTRNLRTLKFIMDVFQKVFELDELNKNEKHANEVLDRFLYFTTTYSIEYKNGISSEELDELEYLSNRFYYISNLLLPESENSNGKAEHEKKYSERFAEKYFEIEQDNRFEYSKAIADYIHTGYLNESQLITQSDNIIRELIKNEETSESKIIKKLGNLFMLENDELGPLIVETLEKVENGDFDLISYPNIYSFFIKLEYYNLGNIIIDDAFNTKFKKGIDISKNNSVYSETFRSQLPFWSSEKKEEKWKYEEIANYALEANEFLLNKKVKAHVEAINESLIKINNEELYEKITDMNYRFTPVFASLDPEDFFKIMKRSSNNSLYNLYLAFSERYESSSIDHKIAEEHQFFSDLNNIISNYLNDVTSDKRTVQIVWFEIFRDFTDKIKNRLILFLEGL